MQKNRKITPKSTQIRMSSNDSTARNRKIVQHKKAENPVKYAAQNQKVNISEKSSSGQNLLYNNTFPQMQSKLNKVAETAEKSDSASVVSTNNTEREIAETLYLLKNEINEWKAQETLRSQVEDSERFIVSSDEQVGNGNSNSEAKDQPEGIEALCLELDKIRTSGSTVISTFRHQCDSGRLKKTEEEENYFKPLELPIQSKNKGFTEKDISKSWLSFNNKLSLIENVNQNMLSSEEIPFSKNLCLSPQTVQVLENVEALVENSQKQLTEITNNISFYKKNPEIPEAQRTIDEDLLRLRQIVELKFREANSSSKLPRVYDHKKYTDSMQHVPEEKNNKVPRLLKYMTMLSENCCLKEDECCKKSYHSERKIFSPFNTCDKINSKQEKAAQTDDIENKTESSTFQIQTGPKVIIERSLKVQNVENFHVSPETSFRQPANIGVYNFQYETLLGHGDDREIQVLRGEDSEKEFFFGERNLGKKQILRDGNSERKQFFGAGNSEQILREENSERKQIFRKSVVLKNYDDFKIRGSFKKVSEKISGKTTEVNDFSEGSELNEQSPAEHAPVNSTKLQKQCNIANAKTKAYFDYLCNLERNLESSVGNRKTEVVEVVPSCEKGTFSKKPTIISNERVNFKYRDILKGSQFQSLNPSFNDNKDRQFDEFSKESIIEIDNINLKKPCAFDLDTALKKNNEIIENVIQNTDVILSTISSDFKPQNNNNDCNSKINCNLASLQNLISPKNKLESIKSTLKKNFPNKYPAEKENESKFQKERRPEGIIGGISKLPKFMSSKTEVNKTANEENFVNSSSISVNFSSKENLNSQNSVLAESSPALSKDATLNDLKDLSVDIFFEEIENSNAFHKNSREVLEENLKDQESKISSKGVLKESKEDDNEQIKKDDKSNQSFPDNLNVLHLKKSNYGDMEIFSCIFESLKHSSAVIKRFITCLFGETEARIENEIISILREIGVNATIINQFLIILQNRDKNPQLITFIKDLETCLNLTNDNNIEYSALRKQLDDFLEKSKTNSGDSETDKKLRREISTEIESKDKKYLPIKLDFDVTVKDKKVIYDDSKLVVAKEKADLIKPREKVNKHFVDKSDGDSSSKQLIAEILVDKSKNNKTNKIMKEGSDSSLGSMLQSEKINSKKVKLHGLSDNKSLSCNEFSVIDLSKRFDYSQNFTDGSSTSKYCKSLESHVSLKLSDSFMNKKEDLSSKERSTERNVELEIQQKVDNLLDMEKRDAQSIEESIKTEISNLTKESDSPESLKRKSLVRGGTFIIKKSNLDCHDKSTDVYQSDFSSLNDSQKEFKFRTPSVVSERSKVNYSTSSEISSEGEVYLVSSSSYSLGGIRKSQQESLKKPSDKISSKTNSSNKTQNSSSSSDKSKSRSLGEFYR